MSPELSDNPSENRHVRKSPCRHHAQDAATVTLRRVFARMVWRNAPIVRLRYRRADDVLVAGFLPIPAVRTQYPGDHIQVEFDGDDAEALPTALTVTGFLAAVASPANNIVRELLGEEVWRRAVELAVSDESEREVGLDPAQRDALLAAWRKFSHRPRRALGVRIVPGRVYVVLVDDRGEILERRARELSITCPRTVVDAVGELVDELRSLAVDGLVIGIEIGGPVDRKRGTVYGYNKGTDRNPMAWENAPLGALVEERCGAPAVVLNDAEALATYELWFGSGTSTFRFAVLLVDEGIGGALVDDGKIDTKMPMELGNLVVHANGRKCRCGNSGCVEATVSTWAIVERVQEVVHDSVADLAEVVDLAERESDPRSGKVGAILHSAGQDLATGIGSVQAIANPERWTIYVPPELDMSSTAKEKFLSGLNQFELWVSYKPLRSSDIRLRRTTGEEGAQGAALSALEAFGISCRHAASRPSWNR